MKWSLLCNPTIKWPHNKKECVLANIKFKYINLKIKRIINNNYHWILILFTPTTMEKLLTIFTFTIGLTTDPSYEYVVLDIIPHAL